MAGTPGDMRVRAAALASEQGNLRELGRLARIPLHRSVLDGTAAAVHVLQRRLRGTPFSEFEGILTDPAAIDLVGSTLGEDFCFASQIETYIACPFQFFSRFVLRLGPPVEREELDVGYTQRGSVIHEILEEFERRVIESGYRDDVDDLVPQVIDRILNIDDDQASVLETGLRTLERNRARRVMDFYLAQREAYAGRGEVRARPRFLEQAFGDKNAHFSELEIGSGDRIVRLQGKIDRIDLIETPSGRCFRVIDYKSGSVPSLAEVKNGEMVQLILYAMAAGA